MENHLKVHQFWHDSGGVGMESNPIIAKHLKRTGGFQDVNPVILASGEIGIYYVNTEKLLEDAKEFENYGNDAGAMYQHAVNVMKKSKSFEEVIHILAEKTKSLLSGLEHQAISGGQRRDWLFSAPVAHLLKLPHVSLYKQESGQPDRIEVYAPDGTQIKNASVEGSNVVHIVDLITEGSSCYDIDAAGKVTGWIPMLCDAGANIDDLIAVVTRLQGGEENLAKANVTVHSMVAIDKNYLAEHSQNPERAVTYFTNPTEWSKQFLEKEDMKSFARFFDPNSGKVDRVRKFVERYGKHLTTIGKFNDLDALVKEHYGLSIDEVMQGKTLYQKNKTFVEKWKAAIAQKNSILCAGLDPAEYWQRPDNTLPDGVDKLAWCLDFIEKISPYAAAVKPNRNFIKDLSREKVQKLVKKIHELGMVAIDDSKLVDIGTTNDSGLYNSQIEGFDSVTYASFPGNTKEAVTQAHNRGLGLISLVLMSNPEFESRKNMIINGMKFYELNAKEAADFRLDAIVVGAPSPSNHITDAEVRRVKEIVGERLVLMPGVGAQGGDAKYIIDVFGDNVIANVGTAIMYAKDPAKEAEKYRNMLNTLRKA